MSVTVMTHTPALIPFLVELHTIMTQKWALQLPLVSGRLGTLELSLIPLQELNPPRLDAPIPPTQSFSPVPLI